MVFQKDQRFGMVVLLNEEVKIGRRTYQKVRCDCGTEKLIRNDRFPDVTSCNCLRKNPCGISSADYERLYGVWRNMVSRCYDKNSERYYAYGEKGITVCREWLDNFREFAIWAVKNGWKVGLSIERKDVTGNYCPENCTFITMKEQARNKTSNVLITHNGETHCVVEWCEILGIKKPKTVYRRIHSGHTDPEIILYNGDLRDLRREMRNVG